ncbi:MAG: hypothetical protein ACTS45_01240 [Candidatus Hodgkinia cicadicola]
MNVIKICNVINLTRLKVLKQTNELKWCHHSEEVNQILAVRHIT